MDNGNPLTLEHLKVISLKHDDVLVYVSPHQLGPGAVGSIKAMFAESFPDNKVLVLPPGAKLDIMRPDAAMLIDAEG